MKKKQDKNTRRKSLDDAKTFVTKVAEHQGWDLVKDEKFLFNLEEGLMVNYNRYGYFQCPCREAWGEREADRDVICPCIYAKPDIDEYGHCYCSLFFRKSLADEEKQPEPIPERRPEEKIP